MKKTLFAAVSIIFSLSLTQSASANFMIAAANQHAAKAGYRVLQKGGSAVDAAIATQLVLNLVEPQFSGIGGGAFMVHWHAGKKRLTTFDGRETAPAAADEKLFWKDGKPMQWANAVVGGKSVGAPGTLKMLELAHQQYGRLPWHELFKDAIHLAQDGFKVSPLLHRFLKDQNDLNNWPQKAARNYFYPNGQALAIGTVRKNKKLAKTFRKIAKNGSKIFYEGKLAKNIVKTVQKSKRHPGLLSLADLKNYQSKERPAVCANYRTYNVCGMGPPTSGGLTVLQILSILNNFNLSYNHSFNERNAHIYTQAAKLAYADREKYIADADFINVPVDQLLDRKYLKKRSRLIRKNDMGEAKPGTIKTAQQLSSANSPEINSTSHFSIIDQYGNAVSMTTSIEAPFGSRLMVDGFLLNNQLTDFSFVAEKNGVQVANRIQASKRPRSSMSPMIIFDKNNQLKMLIGSPGGSRIINYVAQTIIAVLDWGKRIQIAIDMPKIVNRNGVTELEEATFAEKLQKPLERRGHKTIIKEIMSGLHGIVVTNNGYQGGADSRREGVVLGR